jgi:hypothetical protein
MKHIIFASVLTTVLCACASEQVRPEKLLGQPATPTTADRTIRIGPDTRYVNVEGGEIIRFVVGDKAFGWSFNGSTTVSNFSLNRVAPAGVLDHDVTAYVAPDPKYIGPD